VCLWLPCKKMLDLPQINVAMRYFIQISYHGADFKGWQVQPGQVTVQGELSAALSVLLSEDIGVIGCGRTDTGVHASYFIAHFDSSLLLDCKYMVHKLNRFMRLRLAVQDIWPVPEGANSRFDAVSRTYKYYISTQKSPFFTDTSYYFGHKLDFCAMQRACGVLFLYSDFTSFSRLHSGSKTNICRITEANWEQNKDYAVFTISANRFLRNMVRAIVGTMLQIGQGKIGESQLRRIIESKDRSLAGASAPGHGLFLVNVAYPAALTSCGGTAGACLVSA
jgi:tRNA pseudouridine38-40 synthase